MKRFLSSLFFIGLSLQAVGRIEKLAHRSSSITYKEINGEVLQLNGIGIHRRFIFDIYRLALYLKKPTKDSLEIISSKETKFAEMKFLRNLDAKEVQDGFRDTFNENCPNYCDELSSSMEKLLTSIPDIKDGETINFTFLPTQTIIAIPGGKSLSFEGAEFGKFFIRAWLGASPPSERFKREILKGT
ncbi:MAG: chalcone isomerase family protein [Bdellovibrionota bacterium]